jgi:DNA polymerase III alpha subunit
MQIDKYGLAIYDSQDLIVFLYQDKDFKDVLVDGNDPEIDRYIQNLAPLNLYQDPEVSIEDFDRILQSNWWMPEEYKNIDIEDFLVNVCPKQNYQRMKEELEEFRSRNMIDLLKWLKYFVDTCRKNNIVWGVGRGSSVSSYVLFLLGIHKIDSIKYKLDWRDFLR